MFPAMLDYTIRTVYPHLWERHRGADLPAGPADSKFDMCAKMPACSYSAAAQLQGHLATCFSHMSVEVCYTVGGCRHA